MKITGVPTHVLGLTLDEVEHGDYRIDVRHGSCLGLRVERGAYRAMASLMPLVTG